MYVLDAEVAAVAIAQEHFQDTLPLRSETGAALPQMLLDLL
jgi:hypothetical protein